MSAQTARPPWLERPSRAYLMAKIIVFTMILVAVIYPLLSVVATSLASQQDVDEGGGMVLFPAHPSLDAYSTIFQGGTISRAIVVSVGITVVGTLLSLAVTTGLAYGLSRPVVFRKPLLMLALFSLLFQPGIIPSYLVVKELGLTEYLCGADLAGHAERLQPGRHAPVLHGNTARAHRQRAHRRRQ